MCLALPARVLSKGLDGADLDAVVEVGGVRKSVSLALVPEAEVGDYVIVHVGYAIGRLDAQEAEQTLALFGELARLQADEDLAAAGRPDGAPAS